jgi:LemA protein
MLWWLLAGAGVLVVVCALLYNRLVKLRNRVDNAWSQVDVQLRRRYDLIPDLVATVKVYAAHESETLGVVVRPATAPALLPRSRSRAGQRVP